VQGFIDRFSGGIAAMSDYSAEGSPFVRQFLFEVNFDTLAGT
jgi:hypothetical protein